MKQMYSLYSRLQTICKTSVRYEKHARRDTCVQEICIFMLLHEKDFSSLTYQTISWQKRLIMYETKGFSHAIGDKRIVRVNNRIAKCV